MEVRIDRVVCVTAVTSGARREYVSDWVIFGFVQDDHVRVFDVEEVFDVGQF